jgi:hypothetical protein
VGFVTLSAHDNTAKSTAVIEVIEREAHQEDDEILTSFLVFGWTNSTAMIFR